MKVNDLFDQRKRGITLISLVVTIIVLIILASVSINLIIDTNLIQRVASAKEPNEIESIREKLELVKGSMYLDNKGKANIDLYFASLSKEKIVPYTVSKTQKFTENIGVVEVDNKYSFLIKFENSIEIKYEGKIGEVERQEPVIEITITGLKQQENLPIALTAEVTDNGEKVTSGKWVLNKKSENMGTDKSLYTGNILENGSINLEIQEIGEYFLHILTTDVYGRTKETIKGPISVTEKYHTHIGASSSKEGCYTTPVYHSHTDSCYKKCTGVLKYLGKGENNNGVVQGRYKCSVCGFDTGYIGAPYINGEAAGQACWSTPILNCSKGGTVSKYDIGCGKTEETQEGYTISY